MYKIKPHSLLHTMKATKANKHHLFLYKPKIKLLKMHSSAVTGQLKDSCATNIQDGELTAPHGQEDLYHCR